MDTLETTAGSTAPSADEQSPGRRISPIAPTSLLVIPVAVFLCAILLHDARGPHRLGLNSDPDYVYLLNALNLLMFRAPGHVDHPGITVQLLGAVIVFFRWLLGCLFGNSTPLELEVLRHPEEFLGAIQLTFSLLIAAAVFWAGRTMYRFSRNLWASLILQATVFLFRQIPVAMPLVSPEPLLVVAGFAMVITVIPVIFAQTPEGSPGASYRAGVTFALGMFTKMTFITWLAVAALFSSRKAKLRFLLAALVTMLVLALPIAAKLTHTLGLAFAMLTHTGRYGNGTAGFTTVSNITTHWQQQAQAEPTFYWWLFFYYAAAAVLHFGLRDPKDLFANRVKRLIWVACACMTLQLAMSLKHFAPHYILPCLISAALLNGFLVILLSSSALASWARRSLAIAGASLLIVSVGLTATFLQDYSIYQRERAADLRELDAKRSVLQNCISIPYYRSSLQIEAFDLANDYSDAVHVRALEELYPNSLIFKVKHFVNFRGDYKDLEVSRMVADGKCVLIQGNDRGALPPEFYVQRIAIAGNGKYTSEAETVLRLTSMPAPKIENPTLLFPTREEPVVSSPLTLKWQPVYGAEDYWVDIGTAPTKGDLSAGYSGGEPFFTANLSKNYLGRTLYVQLYSKRSGFDLQPATGAQYQFQVAAALKPGNPELTAPAPGTVLQSSPVTFTWNRVESAQDYWIDVGTAPATGNIFGGFTKGLTSVTVKIDPDVVGGKVYVQLFAKTPGAKLAPGTGSLYQFATVPAPH